MKWYHYRGNVIEEQPSPSSDQPATNAAPAPPQATVIPGVDSLLGGPAGHGPGGTQHAAAAGHAAATVTDPPTLRGHGSTGGGARFPGK